jgi:hypothetical protein
MNTIDFGQTLGILANLAVVAGIVFLIVQMREERDYAIVAQPDVL